MINWIYLSTVFIVLTTGLKKDPMQFSKSIKELTECIENHDLLNDKKLPYQENEVGKAIAALLYKRIFW